MSDDEGLVDRLDASDWFGVCDNGRGGVRAVSYHKSKANAPASTLQIFTLFEVCSSLQQSSAVPVFGIFSHCCPSSQPSVESSSVSMAMVNVACSSKASSETQ